jgi:hypothetical protein
LIHWNRCDRRDMKFIDLDNIGEFAAHRLALASSQPAEQLTKREFQLPFLQVTGLFSDASFAQLCAQGLARPSTSRHLAEPIEQEIEIRVTSGGGGAELAVWRESSFAPGVFDRVISGHRLRGYYNHKYRFWQFYDPTTGRGIQSMLDADLYPPWESSSPLRAFLHWAYDGLGMRLAHAATLGVDGRGVLLAGTGGSGKSGTTLAGILHGMSTVGDDYVLLDCGPTRQAHAVFANMKQDTPGLERVGLDPSRLGGGRLNWQNKLEFSPAEVRRGAMTDRLEIVAILLPKIAHRSRTTLRPVRPAEAMLSLAPSGLFQMPGCAASGVRFFSQFVRETPAYEMLLSEEPADIADAMHELLSKKELAHAG